MLIEFSSSRRRNHEPTIPNTLTKNNYPERASFEPTNEILVRTLYPLFTNIERAAIDAAFFLESVSAWRSRRDSNKSSTALRAFRVLETVANSSEPLGVAEVARLTGLDRATCYRMLRTIEQAGYVVHDRVTKSFRPSRRIISLAKHLLGDDESRMLVSQTLKQISKVTAETSHYSEMDGDSAVLTQRSKGTQLVAVDFQIGERYPLHTTSVGKAILAHQDDSVIAAYLERPLARLTPRTITDPVRLHDELQKVRDTGISYDHCELAEGMNCVAVPVRGPGGNVLAGISISGPDTRFTEAKLNDLAAKIKAQSDLLTSALLGEG